MNPGGMVEPQFGVDLMSSDTDTKVKAFRVTNIQSKKGWNIILSESH